MASSGLSVLSRFKIPAGRARWVSQRKDVAVTLWVERGVVQLEHDGQPGALGRHQIIGIDVNWNKRQRFVHDGSRTWLQHVLAQGDGPTTILLSGSAPFVYGHDSTTALYDDLKEWHANDRFAMWFWGDDHYCALFERDAGKTNFVGSCIGHAGFPGDRQAPDRDSFVPTTWVETEPRFPKDYDLRDDMGNNGWVELALLPSGGVELLYRLARLPAPSCAL